QQPAKHGGRSRGAQLSVRCRGQHQHGWQPQLQLRCAGATDPGQLGLAASELCRERVGAAGGEDSEQRCGGRVPVRRDGPVDCGGPPRRVITTEYFYLNGTPVALATAPTALYFIHPDHIDTPRVVSDASGNIVWRWDSADAFGSTAANGNPS